jgi:hypothetical protein
VDSGFKKLKGNQMEILNELRSEFDKIRSMPAMGHKFEDKLCSSSDQNASRAALLREGSSSDLSSEKDKQTGAVNP